MVGMERSLGLFGATMLIVGNVIGIGIFTTPGVIAEAIPNPIGIIALWILGGILTLLGALTYVEIGTALPYAGGEYVYLREAYGPACGFLNGWTNFLVINPGSIALMSVAAIVYVNQLLPVFSPERFVFRVSWSGIHIGLSYTQCAAIAIIVGFSALNCLGIRAGSMIQNVLTTVKIGAIAAIVLFGFAGGRGSLRHFVPITEPKPSGNLLGTASLAMICVFFSYTGWFTSTYVAGEIREPERNIRRSIIYGTVIVTAIYVMVNAAYLYAMPPQRMRGLVNAGEATAQILLGSSAATCVSAAILVAILGAINSVILTAPRIYYAMAQDGLFFRAAGALHPRHKTPVNSILLQAAWASLLVLMGTFNQLLTYTSVSMLAFSIMTAVGVFILRKTRPEIRRPYLVPGYPWIPIIFIIAYALILVYVIVSKPWESLAGLGITAIGILWYQCWKSWARKGNAVQNRSESNATCEVVAVVRHYADDTR